jgi:hypothetical protein
VQDVAQDPAFAVPRGGGGLQCKIKGNLQRLFEEKVLADEDERQDECLLAS